MSNEISRRDFLKLVLASAPAAALAGGVAFWPDEALSRPVAEPAILTLDESGYVIDQYFDFCSELPTFREFLSLQRLTPTQIKEALEDEFWRFEYLVADPSNWSVAEIEDWLDTNIEMADMSPRAAMAYTQYGPGIELYECLGWEAADDLGLIFVEGEMPGNDFVGVKFQGDIDQLNAGLVRHGLNLIVREG